MTYLFGTANFLAYLAQVCTVGCIAFALYVYGKPSPRQQLLVLLATSLAGYLLLQAIFIQIIWKSNSLAENAVIFAHQLLVILVLHLALKFCYIFPSMTPSKRQALHSIAWLSWTVGISWIVITFCTIFIFPARDAQMLMQNVLGGIYVIAIAIVLLQRFKLYRTMPQQALAPNSMRSFAEDSAMMQRIGGSIVMILLLLIAINLANQQGLRIIPFQDPFLLFVTVLIALGSLALLSYLNDLMSFMSGLLPLCVAIAVTPITILGYVAEAYLLPSHPILLRQLIFGFSMTMIVSTLFLVAVAPFLLRRLLVSPLDLIMRSIMRVDAGDLEAEIDYALDDELGLLSSAFNRMLRSVRESRVNLEVRVEERTRDLQAAKHSAEIANQAKSSFVSHVSHELRTPLNTMLGYTQLLQRQHPEQRELNIVLQSGEHLQALLSDLLDISSIEAGQLTLQPALLDLRLFMHSLQDMFAERARAKKLTLVLDIDENLPTHIVADAIRLRQVIVNLLENAIKFSDAGIISFSVHGEQTQQGPLHLCVSVKDDGIGIATEHLDSIFTPFQQVAKRHKPGVGLGLAISRHLVQLMGGELAAVSEMGLGSRFYFEIDVPVLSIGDSSDAQLRPILEVAGPAPRLIVVDDNQDHLNLLADYLQDLGCNVETFVDGQSALDAVRISPPSAVITDWMMPAMSGAEFISKLRSDGHIMPIIVASAAVASVQNAEVEFDAIVSKPIDLAVLQQELTAVVGIEWRRVNSAEKQPTLAPTSPLPPVESRVELHSAAQMGDLRQVRQCIDAWSVDYPEFVATARTYTDTYRLTMLANWLDSLNNVVSA